jgi:predicted Zn-dependent protease
MRGALRPNARSFHHGCRMNVISADSASTRLQRLAGFLAHDPENPTLLAEACDTALACGRHEQADAFIAAAERLAPGSADWQLRRAQLCIARRELPQARALLEQLCASRADHPVLLHDLAYVHLLAGDAARARSVLQPWAQEGFLIPEYPHQVLQALWLRACHHLGHMEEAWDWTQRAQAAHALVPAAAGVASLVALDLEDPGNARTLADLALAADADQPEALVSRGCLALTAGSAGEAVRFLERAAQRLPGDARVSSALGFAHLLSGDGAAACVLLERAVQAMPDHVDLWQALGWARWLLKDVQAAIAAFQAAVHGDDEAADSHAALALVLLMAGERDAAAANLHRAELLDPQDGTAALVRSLQSGQAGRRDVENLVRGMLAQWRPRP